MVCSERPAWINALRLRRIDGDPLELREVDVDNHPSLKEAFRRADEEYTRILENYPETAYELITKPSSVPVKPSESEAVAELLGCLPSENGRYSRVVVYRGVYYSVSIVTTLCG